MNTVSPDGKLPSKDALDAPYTPPDAPQLIDYTEQILAGSMLLGMDHAQRKITAADDGGTDIPKVSFDEAVQYLKGKIPVTKEEWDGLSDKLRFRAFTVAKLAEYDYINQAKNMLSKAIADGSSYSDFFEEIKEKIGNNALSLKPGYWENVYRTNTATAYTAGKLMQFQKSKPIAIELFFINDERQSKICKNLSSIIGTEFAISINHPFIQKYGFPPYHFSCRTGFRGIYNVTKDIKIINPDENVDFGKFKPMDGFGGNPLNNGNWFDETESQKLRAISYGIQTEIKKERNLIKDDFNSTQSSEKFAEDNFINKDSFDGIFNGKVDYSGISPDHTMQINNVLMERYDQFPNVPKLSGIKVVSPSSALGKRVFSDENSIASYDSVRGGIYLNKNVLKDEEAFKNFIKRTTKAKEYVLAHMDDISDAQKKIVENYIKAGRSLVNGNTVEGIINHEFSHHIELNMIRTDKYLYKELIDNMDKYAVNISGYATTKGNEYLAESISAYINGEFSILDPDLVNKLSSFTSPDFIGKKAVSTVYEEIKSYFPKEKLTEYALNPLKCESKAIAFQKALGYNLNNYQKLIDNVIEHTLCVNIVVA